MSPRCSRLAPRGPADPGLGAPRAREGTSLVRREPASPSRRSVLRQCSCRRILPSTRPALPPVSRICTVPIVDPELHENMGVACPLSIPTSGAQRTLCSGRRRVGGFQVPSRAPFGEPRPPSPTRRPASLGEAAETDRRRSTLLGLAARSLGRLAICLGHRQAGDHHRLAPKRLPTVFDLGQAERAAARDLARYAVGHTAPDELGFGGVTQPVDAVGAAVRYQRRIPGEVFRPRGQEQLAQTRSYRKRVAAAKRNSESGVEYIPRPRRWFF